MMVEGYLERREEYKIADARLAACLRRCLPSSLIPSHECRTRSDLILTPNGCVSGSSRSTPPTVRRYSSRPNYLSAKRNPSLHTTTAFLTTLLIHRIISKNRPTAIRAVAKNHEEEKNAAESREMFLSDVVVRSSRRVYWGRRWNYRDVTTASAVLSMHVLCLFAPFAFTWSAFWMALSLYLVTGLLGITLSFHRNLSHRSFKLPKWLEYSFAYCGVQALQGNPLDWVSTHRYHHQYCDSDRDPHSPIEGFWYSHMSWLFDTNSVIQRCGEPSNVGDLEKQSFYRFMRSTYVAHPVALAMLLYAVGGFPFIVWGMGVRIVWVYHITWLVNSACHVWGRQSWNAGDLSRNNWSVALLAFGEGWHNNHHAFEYSARHGLEWWQLDFTWYVVWLLQAIGLATVVKVPSQAQKQRMLLNTGTTTM